MRRFILALAACALLGCASKPAARNVAAFKAGASGDGSFSLTALDEAALEKGKCGMILWTLDANRPAAVLRYISGGQAEIEVDGKPVVLDLRDSTGGGEFGVAERQQFGSEAGFDVSTEVHFGIGFDGGVYLERGVLKVRAPNGWEVVAPTAGIAGCRG